MPPSRTVTGASFTSACRGPVGDLVEPLQRLRQHVAIRAAQRRQRARSSRKLPQPVAQAAQVARRRPLHAQPPDHALDVPRAAERAAQAARASAVAAGRRRSAAGAVISASSRSG
jgi:hypothetical protein